MTEEIKKYWFKLYECAQSIGDYLPWERFSPENCFAYLWRDKSRSAYFSFYRDEQNRRAVSCHFSEADYLEARRRRASPNPKNEPVSLLQNGWICLWDDGENLSEKDTEVIRALGLTFRGKGAWLHFDRCQIGYCPVPPEERDVPILLEAFGNLYMMLRAVVDEHLDPQFGAGKMLLRWYEPKEKRYYTHPFEIQFSDDVIKVPVAKVEDNERLGEIRGMETLPYSVQLDWSYVNLVYRDEKNRDTVPRMLFGVAAKEGYTIILAMLPPNRDHAEAVWDELSELTDKVGKPKEISVCDEELYGILQDFCEKAGIPLKKRKNLPALEKARKKELSQYGA